MPSHKRKQAAEWTLIETVAGLGAVIGVLTTAAHPAAHACSRAATKAGTCLAQAVTSTLTPYAYHAVGGLLLGGALAIVAVLVRRSLATAATQRLASPRSFGGRTAPSESVSGPESRAGVATAAPIRVAERNRPGRERIAERVRHEVWRRDLGSCVDCGSRERLEFDHIIPASRGGSSTARNIELRCETCNGRKGARI